MDYTIKFGPQVWTGIFFLATTCRRLWGATIDLCSRYWGLFPHEQNRCYKKLIIHFHPVLWFSIHVTPRPSTNVHEVATDHRVSCAFSKFRVLGINSSE
jgi:hypothetical protein